MKKHKFAEVAFFKELVRYRHGLAVLSKAIGVDYWILNNWMVRGNIPIEETLLMSQKLHIHPYILNNRHFHYIADWKALLGSSKILPRDTITAILRLPLKYGRKTV